jgi:hypothetical protein
VRRVPVWREVWVKILRDHLDAMESELPELVSLIYEAAAIPERWPIVLATLSRKVDGVGGLLRIATSPEKFRWTSSPNLHDDFVEFIRDGWAAINPRPARIAAVNHAGFIRDNDHFTAEELDNDPVYGFLRSKGLGYAAGTILSVPSGDSIIFSFEKPHADGPVAVEAVAFLDSQRPHLARGSTAGLTPRAGAGAGNDRGSAKGWSTGGGAERPR